MKVILLRDVARIGRKGTVAEVPDGYAFNQLIPSRSAEAATPQNLKKIARNNEHKANQQEADSASFDLVKAALKNNTLKISAESSDKGHLFKAVSPVEIAEAAAKQDIVLRAADIMIDSPIKELGKHELSLVHGKDSCPLVVEVVSK